MIFGIFCGSFSGFFRRQTYNFLKENFSILRNGFLQVVFQENFQKYSRQFYQRYLFHRILLGSFSIHFSRIFSKASSHFFQKFIQNVHQKISKIIVSEFCWIFPTKILSIIHSDFFQHVFKLLPKFSRILIQKIPQRTIQDIFLTFRRRFLSTFHIRCLQH